MKPGYMIMTMLAAVLMLFGTGALAQEIEFASSPNPVGSGARALGMGGAFIAVADDATAASWNPGGLVQLELPELSVVGAGFYREEDNTFGGHPESDGSQSVADGSINYLSGAYPFNAWGRNMIVALTYQHLYDFNRDFAYHFLYSQNATVIDRDVRYSQEGGLSAIGLSYAVQALPSLSIGLTLNIWNDKLGVNNWEQDMRITGSGSVKTAFGPLYLQETYRNLDEYEFSGLNFNLGFLWRFNEALTVGGVFKAPFTADIDHDFFEHQVYSYSSPRFPGLDQTYDVTAQASYREELDMPASYGIGVSYRFSDTFTAAFDLYRTEWEDMVFTDHAGVKTSAVSGVEVGRSDIGATVQARAGAEYLLIRPKYIIPLRAGLFYDPAPSEGGNDDYYGVTLGTGVARGRYIFDVGYQLRFGSDVGSALYKSGELSQDVAEHTLYASLIVHF